MHPHQKNRFGKFGGVCYSMEAKHIVQLQKLCLSSGSNTYPLKKACRIMHLPYHNVYKFFRDGRSNGLFELTKADGLLMIRFRPGAHFRMTPLIRGPQNSNFFEKSVSGDPKSFACAGRAAKPRVSKTINDIDARLVELHECLDLCDIDVDAVASGHHLINALTADLEKNNYARIDSTLNQQLRTFFENVPDCAAIYEALSADIRLMQPRRKTEKWSEPAELASLLRTDVLSATANATYVRTFTARSEINRR